MATIKQIGNLLEKSFSKWDYKKAIKLSDNETKTRDYLIEPVFNMLGYSKMDHYSHEYSLKISKGSVQKVDMVVSLNGKSPIMLVECKTANANLTKAHFNQLSGYYDNHKESKIGILTNGIVYEFYAVKWNDNAILNDTPFLIFDLRKFTRADLEDLANFHIQLFNTKDILNISEETYFFEDFNIALTKTLHPAGDELTKLIYQNMGGKRLTEKVNKRLQKLINSVSLQNSIEKIKFLEGKQSSSGIVTTPEELKAHQIIKTILVMNPRLKDHAKRFSYKDYKGQFKIIVDEMPSKEICHLELSSSALTIVIDNISFKLSNVSTFELTKYKKKLVDSALKYI